MLDYKYIRRNYSTNLIIQTALTTRKRARQNSLRSCAGILKMADKKYIKGANFLMDEDNILCTFNTMVRYHLYKYRQSRQMMMTEGVGSKPI